MNYALILSGGIDSRMNNKDIPKQYIKVHDKPIIIYTLEQFEKNSEIDKIVIVVAKAWKTYIQDECQAYGISKLLDIAINGETRQESIYSGLNKCMEYSDSMKNKVIIHDAVRPLVSQDMITECLKPVDVYEGCMPVLPLTDTVYFSDNGQDITDLTDRSKLYSGQASEAFDLHKYYEVNATTSKEELSKIRGTTELAFKKGLKIKLIAGDDNNFNITTRSDLARFEMIVKSCGVMSSEK